MGWLRVADQSTGKRAGARPACVTAAQPMRYPDSYSGWATLLMALWAGAAQTHPVHGGNAGAAGLRGKLLFAPGPRAGLVRAESIGRHTAIPTYLRSKAPGNLFHISAL